MVRVYWREKAGAPFRKAQEGLTEGEYWLRYNEAGCEVFPPQRDTNARLQRRVENRSSSGV